VPDASEIQKLEKKSLVTYIYMGQPIDTKFGTGTFMQLNDKFAEVEDIHDYIAQERNMLNEQDQQYMTVSLKVDEDTQMRYVTEVKQALRRAYALKISYSARKRDN
jgi:biopolymer transport protein ExbD